MAMTEGRPILLDPDEGSSHKELPPCFVGMFDFELIVSVERLSQTLNIRELKRGLIKVNTV